MHNNKILGISFALFPVLNIYATGIIPGISIGQCLLLIIFGYYVLLRSAKIRFYFGGFLLYSLVITIYSCLSHDWVQWQMCIYESISLFMFFIIYNCAITYVAPDELFRGLYVIAIPCLLFFYLQFILYQFGSVRISGILPFFPLSNEENVSTFIAKQLDRDRLSSFFQEPAHYAEFMILIFSYVLFKWQRMKYRMIFLTLLAISILLARSAGGYILLFTCLTFWGVTKLLNDKKNRIIVAIIAVLLGFVIIGFLGQNESFMKVTERYKELSFTPEVTENGYSSYIRVLRGYIPFFEVDIIDRILGCGIGSLANYANSHPHSIFLLITDYNPNWVNSFQYILFSTGVIGCILFFRQIRNLYKRTSLLGKALIWEYVLTLVSSGILLTPTSALFLYIITTESNNEN